MSVKSKEAFAVLRLNYAITLKSTPDKERSYFHRADDFKSETDEHVGGSV